MSTLLIVTSEGLNRIFSKFKQSPEERGKSYV